MRPLKLAILLLLPLVAGCQSVLDPAPYSPARDQAVIKNAPAGSTSSTILYFRDPTDAANKLQVLSDGYVTQRDSMLRQQLFFDIPMYGLGAAAIVNPIFNGASNATIAFGLSAAGTAGARTYFAPQTKAGAYNEAAASLSCASVVATAIAPEFAESSPGGKYIDDYNSLTQAISEASSVVLASQLDKNLATALLAARDTATKSQANLAAALNIATNSPLKLQAFANSVIASTDKKVITGEQNVDAALALIRAAPTSASPPKASTPPGPAHAAAPAKVAEQAANLLGILMTKSSDADNDASRINSIWGTLTNCALPSS